MSNCDRPRPGPPSVLSDDLDPRRLFWHRDPAPKFLNRYRKMARRAAAKKLSGLQALAPHLLHFISDERTLHAALEHMAAHGGPAPGPDGVRYEDLLWGGGWQWCRGVRDEIRTGWYARDEERVYKIPKGPGRGFRHLVVSGTQDRVVDRAAVEILQPLLDPLFDPRSFGFRPRKGSHLALATAEQLFRKGPKGVWVSADVRDAFPSVPLGRLTGVVRHYLPDADLLAFIEALIRPDTRPGLRQGSPLSPLLLNLYLHHALDRKWRARNPLVPLIRFADDVLLLCGSENEARAAYADLAELLRNAGLALKETARDAIKEVGNGETVAWMGHAIHGRLGELTFDLTAAAWDRLREALAVALSGPRPIPAASDVVVGWVADKAPCFPSTDPDEAMDRMDALLAEVGFKATVSRALVCGYWQRGHARWQKLRKSLAAKQLTGGVV